MLQKDSEKPAGLLYTSSTPVRSGFVVHQRVNSCCSAASRLFTSISGEWETKRGTSRLPCLQRTKKRIRNKTAASRVRQVPISNKLADDLVQDPKVTALEMASRFAGLNPQLCRDIKQSVRIAADYGFRPSLDFETWAQASSATRPEIQTAIVRFGTRG